MNIETFMTILLELLALFGLIFFLIIFVKLALWCLKCTLCLKNDKVDSKKLTRENPRPLNDVNTEVKRIVSSTASKASTLISRRTEETTQKHADNIVIDIEPEKLNKDESMNVPMEKVDIFPVVVTLERTKTMDEDGSVYDNASHRDSIRSEPVSREERLRQTMAPLFATFKNPLPTPPPRPNQPKPKQYPQKQFHNCICPFCSRNVPGTDVSTSSLVESLKSMAQEIVIVDIEEEDKVSLQRQLKNAIKSSSIETLEALEKLDEAIEEFNLTNDKFDNLETPTLSNETIKNSKPEVPTRSDSIKQTDIDEIINENDEVLANVKQVSLVVEQHEENANDQSKNDQAFIKSLPVVPARSNSIQPDVLEFVKDNEITRQDEKPEQEEKRENEPLSNCLSAEEITPPEVPVKDYEEEDNVEIPQEFEQPSVENDNEKIKTEPTPELYEIESESGTIPEPPPKDYELEESTQNESYYENNNKEQENIIKYGEIDDETIKEDEDKPELPPKDYDVETPTDNSHKNNEHDLSSIHEATQEKLVDSFKEFNDQVALLQKSNFKKREIDQNNNTNYPKNDKITPPKLLGIRFPDGHIRPVRLRQSKKIREILNKLKTPLDESEGDEELLNESLNSEIDSENQQQTGSIESKQGTLRRPVQENLKFFQSLQTQVDQPQCFIYTQVVNEIKGLPDL